MLSAPVFVGLKNYKQMFTQDPLIYKTLFNTFYFTITSVPLKLAFALMVAMLLVNTNKITSIYRAMFYLPSMVGGSVAIAVLWRRMFAGDGLVNALLGAVGLPDDVYWLGNENTAICMVWDAVEQQPFSRSQSEWRPALMNLYWST